MLPSDVGRDPERLARFEREARVLASLNHPNIAAIYGIEHEGGAPFLAMELHRDIASEPPVGRAIHLAHAAGAEERDDFIRAETSARGKGHGVRDLG